MQRLLASILAFLLVIPSAWSQPRTPEEESLHLWNLIAAADRGNLQREDVERLIARVAAHWRNAEARDPHHGEWRMRLSRRPTPESPDVAPSGSPFRMSSTEFHHSLNAAEGTVYRELTWAIGRNNRQFARLPDLRPPPRVIVPGLFKFFAAFTALMIGLGSLPMLFGAHFSGGFARVAIDISQLMGLMFAMSALMVLPDAATSSRLEQDFERSPIGRWMKFAFEQHGVSAPLSVLMQEGRTGNMADARERLISEIVERSLPNRALQAAKAWNRRRAARRAQRRNSIPAPATDAQAAPVLDDAESLQALAAPTAESLAARTRMRFSVDDEVPTITAEDVVVFADEFAEDETLRDRVAHAVSVGVCPTLMTELETAKLGE